MTGPSPVDRGKTGSKHHLICDGGGIPLAMTLTGGNRNDITQLLPLLDSVPPVRGRRGQPHGSGLGVVRWVVERTIAWYHGMKRLRIRWERRDDIHEAFLALATCIITFRHVRRLC